MKKTDGALERICLFLENAINKKRKKSYDKKRAKKTFKSELLDWISAFVFAIVVISLLNMWGCAQFIVPTGSMEQTIMIKDRLVVNKGASGREIYSYGPKSASKTPHRGDVITFYNPEYKNDSPFIESLRDLIYMGTLTLVNLNKYPDGSYREKMFIKRAVGIPGDTVRFINGDVFIKPFGEDLYYPEKHIREKSRVPYDVYRLVDKKDYPFIKAYSKYALYSQMGLQDQLPVYYMEELSHKASEFDYYEGEKQYAKSSYAIMPWKTSSIQEAESYNSGTYVPALHILPLGDNRDNSGDGRYFGCVSNQKINGRAMFVLFPFSHMKLL